jgi:hypothetical protein
MLVFSVFWLVVVVVLLPFLLAALLLPILAILRFRFVFVSLLLLDLENQFYESQH